MENSICKGCSIPFSNYFQYSRCAVCSNFNLDFMFCSQCCARVNFKFSDLLLRRKYCYSCYLILEVTKKPSSFEEFFEGRDFALNNLSNNADSTILPSDKQVISIQFKEICNDQLKINHYDPEDDFEIVRRIGSGSFSLVYEVVNKSSGKKYAAKKMIPNSYEERKLFLNECILSHISRHANIIKVYSIYEFSRCIWLIQELMDFSLSILLDARKMLPDPCKNFIIFEILKGIHYLHGNHRIHRDLKCDNILINAKGKVKLADLGFTAQLTLERSNRDTFAGSPCWIAPEVILKKNYGLKADIWSFGVLLIEIIEGEPPNLRKNQDIVFRKIIQAKIGLKNPKSVHPEYVKIIEDCLNLDPDARPSAAELLNYPFLDQKATLAEIKDIFSSFIDTSSLNQNPSIK